MGWTTVNEAAVPILSAKHTHEELRDTPIVDKTCCVLMANNEILLDLLEAGEIERATARRRLADLGGQGLRRQGGQPRRRRRVEVGQGRQETVRASRRLQQAHAGQDHRRPRRHRGRPRFAAPAPPALQQPRGARQLDHHPGNHEGPRGQPGPPGPPAVPRLRRRRLVHHPLAVGRHRRLFQRPPEPHHRRRRRAVRQHRDHHRRRALAAPALQAHRPQVGQPRRRKRDRLRHRALHLQGKEPGQRRAVGGGPGAAAAHQRPLADLSDHRPPQRGVLSGAIRRSSSC